MTPGAAPGATTSGATTSGTLCTACGACCDGTLFDEVPLEAREITLGGRLSLPIVAAGDAAVMALPCPQLREATCNVYADRPSTCRSYRCGLLIAVEAEQVPLDEGLARVAALRAAARRVRQLLPASSAGRPVMRAVDDLAASVGGRRCAAFMEGHADLVAATSELGVAMRAVSP